MAENLKPNIFQQAYFYNKGQPNQKLALGLRKSIERLLIVGGAIFTFGSYANALGAKTSDDAGDYFAMGVLGSVVAGIGTCFREGRKQFEESGFYE